MYAARLFLLFSFPCSADHERDWPPCKVVFFGLATNTLNVRNNKQQQHKGGFLPGIILTVDPMLLPSGNPKRFCTCSLRFHLNILTFFPLTGGCSEGLDAFIFFYNKVTNPTFHICVCVFSSHPFWTSSSLDVPAGVTQEEGHTGFLIHLLSAVRALIFLARRIQPFLSAGTFSIPLHTNSGCGKERRILIGPF